MDTVCTVMIDNAIIAKGLCIKLHLETSISAMTRIACSTTTEVKAARVKMKKTMKNAIKSLTTDATEMKMGMGLLTLKMMSRISKETVKLRC